MMWKMRHARRFESLVRIDMRCLLGLVVVWGGCAVAQAPPKKPVDQLDTARQVATAAIVANVGRLDTEWVDARGELDTLRAMIGMVKDERQRRALITQLDLLTARMNRLSSRGWSPMRPAERAPVRGPRAADSAELSRLENSLRAANFRDDKLRVIREATKNHFFSTAQVRTIVGHLSHGGDRVEAIAALYPRLTDSKNAHTLFELLSSRTDREALETRLKN